MQFPRIQGNQAQWQGCLEELACSELQKADLGCFLDLGQADGAKHLLTHADGDLMGLIC